MKCHQQERDTIVNIHSVVIMDIHLWAVLLPQPAVGSGTIPLEAVSFILCWTKIISTMFTFQLRKWSWKTRRKKRINLVIKGPCFSPPCACLCIWTGAQVYWDHKGQGCPSLAERFLSFLLTGIIPLAFLFPRTLLSPPDMILLFSS